MTLHSIESLYADYGDRADNVGPNFRLVRCLQIIASSARRQQFERR